MLDAASTFDDAGFEVALFSAGCTLDATAARRELRRTKHRVDSSWEKVGCRLGWEEGVTSCETLRVQSGGPPHGFL